MICGCKNCHQTEFFGTNEKSEKVKNFWIWRLTPSSPKFSKNSWLHFFLPPLRWSLRILLRMRIHKMFLQIRFTDTDDFLPFLRILYYCIRRWIRVSGRPREFFRRIVLLVGLISTGSTKLAITVHKVRSNISITFSVSQNSSWFEYHVFSRTPISRTIS